MMAIGNLVVAFVFVFTFVNSAIGGEGPFGVPCTSDSQCKSNYCSAKLANPKTGVVGGPSGIPGLCMDGPGANCPIPGGPGVKYEGEYNYGGAHWYCKDKIGLQNDGPARPPDYYIGGKCSGFWEKIDCRGTWLPQVMPAIEAYCLTAKDPGSIAFCAATKATKVEYEKQRNGQ